MHIAIDVKWDHLQGARAKANALVLDMPAASSQLSETLDRRMDGLIDGLIDGLTDGLMDG